VGSAGSRRSKIVHVSGRAVAKAPTGWLYRSAPYVAAGDDPAAPPRSTCGAINAMGIDRFRQRAWLVVRCECRPPAACVM